MIFVVGTVRYHPAMSHAIIPEPSAMPLETRRSGTSVLSAPTG
jgi:hypothetical protein